MRDIREVREERLVVRVDSVSEQVVRRHVERRRERRAARQRPQLNVHDVVAEATAVGEPVILAGEQAEPIRRRRRRKAHVQPDHLGRTNAHRLVHARDAGQEDETRSLRGAAGTLIPG